MTNIDNEQRFEAIADQFNVIHAKIYKLERSRASMIQRFWAWCKQNYQTLVVSILLSLLIVTNVPNPIRYFVDKPQPTTIEQQAAQGGAVVPFWNDKPSPVPLKSPPENLKRERIGSPSMSTSDSPLPPNPQADNGQKESTRSFRPLIRRTR